MLEPIPASLNSVPINWVIKNRGFCSQRVVLFISRVSEDARLRFCHRRPRTFGKIKGTGSCPYKFRIILYSDAIIIILHIVLYQINSGYQSTSRTAKSNF
jgi:hypothetical protein